MRILKVTLENFGAYAGKHEIQIHSGLTFFLGVNKDTPKTADSNASGKTTVLHAICWALFGMAANKLRGSDLANEDMVTGEKMEVGLYLSEGHTIIRTWKKKGGSVVYTNPMDGKLVGDAAAVEPKINQRLGISYSLFCNSLYLSKTSKSVQFLSAPPAERAKVLSDLVDDSVFQRAAQILKTNNAALETRYTKTQHEVTLRNNSIAEMSSNITRLKGELGTVTEKEKDGKLSAQAKLEALRREMHDTSAAILKRPEIKTAAELEEMRIGLRKRLAVTQEGLGECSPLVRNLADGDTCPTCRAKVSAGTLHNLEKENAVRTARRNILREEQVLITKELASIESRQDTLRNWVVETAEKRTRMAELNNEVAHLQTQLKEVSRGSEIIQNKIEALVERIKVETRAIHEAKAKSMEMASELHVTSKLVGIFQSEMRNLLFDGIRGNLELATDKYIRTVAGDSVSVSYPSKDAAGREKFDILLLRNGKSKDMSSFSGGEAWRATFAALLALREVLLARAGCKLNVLLIDDALGELDNTGTALYVEVLRRLADEGLAENILVTVPKSDSLRDERTVTVVKEKGKAKFL